MAISAADKDGMSGCSCPFLVADAEEAGDGFCLLLVGAFLAMAPKPPPPPRLLSFALLLFLLLLAPPADFACKIVGDHDEDDRDNVVAVVAVLVPNVFLPHFGSAILRFDVKAANEKEQDNNKANPSTFLIIMAIEVCIFVVKWG